MKKRAAGFGELMLRLAPEGYLRFQQTDTFEAVYGGAEANVCAALAQFGVETRFITALPAHAIGQAAFDRLRAIGIDTDFILRQGPRLGIYFAERGAAQRPGKVIYDRAGSSIALIEPGDIDWEAALDGVDWFHFTGITPALGDNVAQCCRDALKVVRAKGIRASCDLNYRRNLWSEEKAREVMTDLVEGLDICMVNEGACKDVFGISAPDAAANDRQSAEASLYVAEEMRKRFGIREIGVTIRRSYSASDNEWSAMLYDGEPHFSRTYRMQPIIERIGGGDAFDAGLIYGELNGWDKQDCVEFAAAAAALKHTVEGDFSVTTLDEVKALMAGEGSGMIQR